MEAVARSIRKFEATSSGYRAEAPNQNYSATFSKSGIVALLAGRDRLGIRTSSVGRGSNRGIVGSPTTAVGKDSAGWPSLRFDRTNFSEWYVNGKDGLHHWMQVSEKPTGSGSNLWVRMSLTGARKLRSVTDGSVEVQTSGHAFTYTGLKAWDAEGRSLPARLTVAGSDIAVSVDDRDATYPLTIDPTWLQEQQLGASDAAIGDSFGGSVAVSGETAVVGARVHNSGTGAAYVFTRTGGIWSEQQKLTASDGGAADLFGCSVSVSGDSIVVGARVQSTTKGAAYVFTRSAGVWSQQAKLTASDRATGDLFATSVAIDGDTVIAGANGKGFAKGAAYVFTRSAGIWSQQAKLQASDGSIADSFGTSVGLSFDTAIVGAPAKSTSKGASYVFVRSGSTWSQQQKLTASDAANLDKYGTSVGVSIDTIAVGASGKSSLKGAAYVYLRTGSSWAQQQKLTASDGAAADSFGQSIAVSGDAVVVGASGKSLLQGAAYLFMRSSGSWSQTQELIADNAFIGDQDGQSVAISGDVILVGANSKDLAAGASYVWVIPGPPQPVVSLQFLNSSLTSGGTTTGRVRLSSPAPTGGQTVSFSNDIPGLTMTSSIFIPKGSTEGVFPVLADVVSNLTVVTVSVLPATGDKFRRVVIMPEAALASVALDVPSLLIGQSATGTVTLLHPAPAGGQTVNVTSNTSSVTTSGGVYVAPGDLTGTFTVQSVGTKSLAVRLTASTGFDSVSSTFAVVHPTVSVSVDNSSIRSSGAVTLTATLSGPAPYPGVIVNFTSDSIYALVATPTVFISPGDTVGTTMVFATTVPRKVKAKLTGQLAIDGPSLARSVTISILP